MRALFSVHVVTRKLKKSVTYYFNVRNPPHEKNLKNNAEKVWRLCFITLLLHPHSRENAGTKWWNKLLEKKSSGIIWKFKIKVLIFAATFAKRKRQKSSLRDLHNSTSSTSIGEEIFRIDTVNRSMTLDYNNGFRSEDMIKQFKQRRVWSWLRMNASDRLNTCKSRGSGGSDTRRRPAHGWVTRMQLAYQRGITRRKSD